MPLIINDSNYLQHTEAGRPVDPDGNRRMFGMFPRDYEKVPYCSVAGSAPLGRPLIPMQEWPDRIADLERNKASLYHVWKEGLRGLVLDQNGIPYCHAFSPALGIMINRHVSNQPFVEISAGSIGGPVTGYKKRGAWIIDDMRHCVENGAASTEFVPMMQISRDGWKSGADENSRLHRCPEFWELQRRNILELGTSLLSLFAVCTGHNWWGHAVTAIRLVDANPRLPATDWRRYRTGDINSWGKKYGEGGYFELEGNKAIPDEQYVLRVSGASVT